MRLLIAILLCATAGVAGAQMYRWTDASGKVHYSSTPPPAGAKDVRPQAAPRPSSAAAPAPAQSAALEQAMKDHPVTLFTTPGCDACDEARKLLNTRSVPFKEISVTEDEQIEQLKKAVGSSSVPSMVVGGDVQKGYEAGAYNRALDTAGYPKAGVLPPRAQSEPGAGGAALSKAGPAAKPAPAGRYSTDNIQDPFKR
jgi:glutaredoxin